MICIESVYFAACIQIGIKMGGGKTVFLVLAAAVFIADAKVVEITDANWRMVMEGEWMLKFYAPWCPACKAVAPVWADFSSEDETLGIHVGEIDVSDSPGLSGRFLVTSLPTIYHVRNGEFRVYSGSRDKEDFVGFIAKQRYTELESVSFWKAPNSITMSVVSLVFQLSMKVRNFHLVMTLEYGFPAWSVYGFFAVCTVSMGLILGMILVFITDFICPTRQPTRPLESGKEPEPEPETESEQDEPVTESDKNKDEEETEETTTPSADERIEETGDTALRKRKTETEHTEEDKN